MLDPLSLRQGGYPLAVWAVYYFLYPPGGFKLLPSEQTDQVQPLSLPQKKKVFSEIVAEQKSRCSVHLPLPNVRSATVQVPSFAQV
jgi:hypothetical protein